MSPPDDPVAVIEFFLEQKGLTRSELEGWLGSRAKVADVMGRKRGLSLEMIRSLREALGIPADLLVGRASTFRPELRLTVALPEGQRRSIAAYVRVVLDQVEITDVGVRAVTVDAATRSIVIEAADASELDRAEPVLLARFPGAHVEHVGYLDGPTDFLETSDPGDGGR